MHYSDVKYTCRILKHADYHNNKETVCTIALMFPKQKTFKLIFVGFHLLMLSCITLGTDSCYVKALITVNIKRAGN